jgi:hypothetical protein
MKIPFDDIAKGGVALARRATKKGVKKSTKAAKTAVGGAGKKPPMPKRTAAASGDAARKKAVEAARQLELRSQRMLDTKKGQQQLIKEWGKLSGRQYYADEAAKSAPTVRSRMAEQARSRGIKAKGRKMGARQNADEAKTIADASRRADRAKAYKESGGKNSASAKARRDSKNANRAKQVRKDIKKNKPK